MGRYTGVSAAAAVALAGVKPRSLLAAYPRLIPDALSCWFVTDTLTLFFSMIAVSGSLFVVAMAVLGLVRLTSGNEVGEVFLEQLRPLAAPLAAIVAVSAMLGSLYYSEIANYQPCRLCWIQRGFMYPSAIILVILVAARASRRLLLVPMALSVVGFAVSIYHRMEQAFPDSVGGACSLDVPCSARWFNEFGFITIPTLAAAAFALIVTFLVVALRAPADTAPVAADPT